MEIYRVGYKQLCYTGREMNRIESELKRFKPDYDSEMRKLFVAIDGFSWPTDPEMQAVTLAKYTSEYVGHKRLIALPAPDIALIEKTIRRFATSKKDASHWLYITEIQYLGSALEFKEKDS